MSGQIIQIFIRYLPYFVLVSLVYLKSGIMAAECLSFAVFTVVFETLWGTRQDRYEHQALEKLIELDENLRMGDSPGFALKALLHRFNQNYGAFMLEIKSLTAQSWMIEMHLSREVDFDYMAFHRALQLIIEEQHWKRRKLAVTSKSRIQLEIMKVLPLAVEWVLIRDVAFSLPIYSVSLWFLFMSNALSFYMYRELFK